MTYETLQYIDANGVTQEVAFQNLSAVGMSNVEWTPRSLAASEFVITLPQPPETPLVIPYKSRCIIRACRTSTNGANNSFSGGAIIFQGRRTDVSASASGGAVSTVVKISDLFWDLAQLTYKLGWQVPSGGTITAPAYTTEFFTDIVMFQPDPAGQLQANGSHTPYSPVPFAGVLISTWQQLMAIVYYAMNFGGAGNEAVQVQMGSAPEFTPNYRNTDTARSIKCLEAIVKCLQAHPGVYSYVDHSTTPPTLHFRDRAHMTAIHLPYKSTDPAGRSQSQEATDIQPLPHLKPDRVAINYKVNGSLNGSSVVNFASDIYPVAGGPFLQTQDYSVDISGLAEQVIQKNFISAVFDPTSLNLWRSRVASLKQISQGGQIINDGTGGALQINLPSITVVDANNNPVDYAGTFIYWTDQSVFSWFKLDSGAPVQVVKATVKALFTYDRTNTLNNEKDKEQEHLHTFKIMLTNAPSGLYSITQVTSAGETAPPGLAQNIFNELSTLQWKLSHKIWQVGVDENTPPAFVCPGNHIINLSGGDPAWMTMNAAPEDVTIMLRRVLVAGHWVLMASHTIRCGPINHLEPGYYVQLWNMFANRKIRNIDTNQRLTGLPSGGTTDLSATEASENSQSAVPTMARQNLIGFDEANPIQFVIQPDATVGQIPVKQNSTDGTATKIAGVIGTWYVGTGAPAPGPLPPGTYYRFNDFYIDQTNLPLSVDIYLCIQKGTNATAVWLLIFSTCT